MTDTVLEIRDLVSMFNTPAGIVRAVDGVSLRVAKGQSLGIVGESGSGKTQTFYGALGLTRGAPGVVAGSARVGKLEILDGLDEHVTCRTMPDGTEVVTRSPQWQAIHERRLQQVLGRDVSIMFQDPKRSLVPYWTIARHLQEVLERAGNRADEKNHRERAAALLVALGFSQPERVLASFPERLSGGEAQRAMLALTMAISPRLLIADEPTTGLDTINQALALESLAELNRSSGMSLILISHDLSVVDAIADDILVMYAGRVVALAPAAVFRDLPADQLHPYALELRRGRERRAKNMSIIVGDASPVAPRASSGCSFHLRCALRPMLSAGLQQRCTGERPPLVTQGNGHSMACWATAR